MPPESLELISSSESFQAYGERDGVVSFGEIRVLLDGYVVPRMSIFDEFKQYGQCELIYRLYTRYGEDFPNFIKGFFSILVVDLNGLLLCNDRHSVQRFYICQRANSYFITNSLDLLKPFHAFQLRPEAGGIQATLQHFVLGACMFEGIEYSTGATLLKVGKNLKKTTYWKGESLQKLKKDSKEKNSVIEVFVKGIEHHLNYLQPKNISLTLTGGRDTRSILAALLHLGVSPHCFTFGYPSGTDVVTARKVSQAANLAFSNHYIQKLDPLVYGELINRIIQHGNPSIHIHRAHRLDAIMKEKETIGDIDAVFVGAMGGDYIMGEGFNDYIITEFLRKYLTEKEDEDLTIRDIFDKHFVRYDQSMIEYLKSFLRAFGLSYQIFDKDTEFKLVHNLIGCTHDIQDIALFTAYSSFVIAPFMDIDFMEALFGSTYSLFSNDRHTKNPFKRLRGGELQCYLIRHLAPLLAGVEFANQYTANDVLGNRLRYVMKRLYLHVLISRLY